MTPWEARWEVRTCSALLVGSQTAMVQPNVTCRDLFLDADADAQCPRGGRAFQLGGGGGGRYSPLASPPPPQKAQLMGQRRNPAKTDPRAVEVTRTQNSTKNENGILGISASRGFRKVMICHVCGEKKS